MGYRTVIISKESRLSTNNEYLLIMQEELTRIHLSEIDVLFIENPRFNITGPLINKLSKNKITTIICDEKHNPISTILSVHGNHRQPKKIKEQISWDNIRKQEVWAEIIKNKIYNQFQTLSLFTNNNKDLDNLLTYYNQVELNDNTNREGLASKIYFRYMYGDDFIRHFEDETNWALNYGYMVLLSMFNTSIISKGYLLELGIHHTSEYNEFNLSCDLIEPFRPIIDYYVKKNITNSFNSEDKHKLLNFIQSKIYINDKQQYLTQAIDIYVSGIFNYLNKTSDNMSFPSIVFNEL